VLGVVHWQIQQVVAAAAAAHGHGAGKKHGDSTRLDWRTRPKNDFFLSTKFFSCI
jgi:hypothetical protein